MLHAHATIAHLQGMTEAEKQAILDAQLAQMEERKARRAQEQLENMMYARSQHDIQRALQEQAQRVEDFKKAQMARAQVRGVGPGRVFRPWRACLDGPVARKGG